jgi:hypothetical protein
MQPRRDWTKLGIHFEQRLSTEDAQVIDKFEDFGKRSTGEWEVIGSSSLLGFKLGFGDILGNDQSEQGAFGRDNFHGGKDGCGDVSTHKDSLNSKGLSGRNLKVSLRMYHHSRHVLVVD